MSAGFDRRALARAISSVENRDGRCDALLRAAHSAGRTAFVLGVTGPPGAGKSTLVDGLAVHWAAVGERVAVLTVDPSSPFSGGALLGDRIRMERSIADVGIYHRSLSARGQLGGMSEATVDILVLLGAEGFDRVILETVGAGQSDIDVAHVADCVLVVSVPGLGDQIQASKAGLMEIGDVYAVNKADRPGAMQARGHMIAMIDSCYMGRAGVNPPIGKIARGPDALSEGVRQLNARHGDPAGAQPTWRPHVILTAATDGSGIADVAGAIDAFGAWSIETGRLEAKRRRRIREQIVRAAAARLLQSIAGDTVRLDGLADRVIAGTISPMEASITLADGQGDGVE